MICCVLFSLIIGKPQRLWRRLMRRHSVPEVHFAPPARRLGPGATATPMSPRQGCPSPARPRRALLLRCTGVGVAVYLVGASVLLVSGAADDRADAWVWLVRSVLFAAVGAASVRLSGPAPRLRSRREVLACALAAGGVTWFELGAVDMHVFALFEIADGAPLGDFLFHGSGVVAAVVGWLLLPRQNVARDWERVTTNSIERMSNAH